MPVGGIRSRTSGIMVPSFVAAVAAAFQGAGDVVSGAVAWWGLRAYNAAYATGSNPALDLTDNVGTTTTINILSTGFLDTATAAPLVATRRVSKLYDQTGNGRHQIQATFATMPELDVSGTPFMKWDNARGVFMVTSGTVTQAQPFSQSIVVQRWQNFTTQMDITIGNATANGRILFANSANNMFLFSGGSTTNFAVSDSAYHAVQALFSGASSAAMVDGTNNAGLNAGTGGYSSDGLQLGNTNVDMLLREAGVWFSDISASFTALNTNQHGSNGWNF